MPGGTITVFLADDNAIVREGVRAILEELDVTVAAVAMIVRQIAVNERWAAEGVPSFGLGVGISTAYMMVVDDPPRGMM